MMDSKDSTTKVEQYVEEKKDDGEYDAFDVTMTADTLPSPEPSNLATTQKLKVNTSVPFILQIIGSILRTIIIDVPLILLFAALVAVVTLHHVHDKYLLPQIQLMVFQEDNRHYAETGYYHRYCNGDEVSATSVSQLLIPENFTGEECVEHQMIHGASVFRDLLTPETAQELRDFIVEENKNQEGFYVIQNQFRYSWGIDVNMHPTIKKYWKELASNRLLVDALQKIVGPDPAVIEFTAITSAYGAKNQHDHQDVVPTGSGAKFPHTFVPSYSLFIPLQDTSYNMGATHVCPGSHLCSEGTETHCARHNLAMSGDDDNWPTGWGALVNQQTTHKGMGHTKKGGLDRVVIIATFAPRPQTFRQLETRMIAQGGSYSMAWSQWGHTLSDFASADKRMWEPLKTMRALGLWKGSGWNWILVTSMRIANDDNGYNDEDALGEFQKKGGLKFLPKSWQGEIEGDYETVPIENAWYLFIIGTIKRTEEGLKTIYKMVMLATLITLLFLDLISGIWRRRWTAPYCLVRGGSRLLVLHGIVVFIAFMGMKTIDNSNWARDITTGKSYRLPELVSMVDENGRHPTLATLPTETDVLLVPHYASDYLAGYGRVIDFAHPGNAKWNGLTRQYAQGYLILSNELQRDFCESLLNYVHQDARFLKQGEEREWLPITETQELFDICHQDMVAASDKRIAAMVRQLKSLQMATKYGRFWNTVLQRNIIPLYLKQWQSILVPQRPWSPSMSMPTKLIQPLKRHFLQTISSTSMKNRRKSSIPKVGQPQEPFPLAWIREGDLVEAMYDCDSEFYYRAKVVSIISSDATFDIEFEDGDINAGLERHCLRPLQPYHVGEQVQIRRMEDQDEAWWVDGTIVDIYLDDDESLLFDINVGNMVLEEISPEVIRRLDVAPDR